MLSHPKTEDRVEVFEVLKSLELKYLRTITDPLFKLYDFLLDIPQVPINVNRIVKLFLIKNTCILMIFDKLLPDFFSHLSVVTFLLILFYFKYII